jgi:iron complex outermembrane receptor protein
MKLSGLQLNGAGLPIIDPATNPTNPYFRAFYDGERHVHDGTQLTAGVNVGLPLGDKGYINLSGEYHYRQPTNRAGYDIRPNFSFSPFTTIDPREVDFNRLQFKFGDPRSRDFNLLLNAGYDVAPDWQVYAFATYGHRNALSAANWRQYTNAANRDWSTISPSTTPNAGNFVPLTPIGFLPLIGTRLRDYAGTIGIRGDLSGWNIDFSAGRGRNTFDYEVHDTVNASFGPQTQSDFDAGGLRYAQNILNLDESHD